MSGFMELYRELEREYNVILDQRKHLNTQATSLMSFSGVILTFLVGIIVTISSNIATTHFFRLILGFHPFPFLMATGFIGVSLAAIFAFVAIWERLWLSTPRLPMLASPDLLPVKDRPTRSNKPTIDSVHSVLDYLFEDESRINYEVFKMFAHQIAEANVIHLEDNRKKSVLIKYASVLLTLGIVITSMAGSLLLTMLPV
jgi:hypothetical protein